MKAEAALQISHACGQKVRGAASSVGEAQRGAKLEGLRRYKTVDGIVKCEA